MERTVPSTYSFIYIFYVSFLSIQAVNYLFSMTAAFYFAIKFENHVQQSYFFFFIPSALECNIIMLHISTYFFLFCSLLPPSLSGSFPLLSTLNGNTIFQCKFVFSTCLKIEFSLKKSRKRLLKMSFFQGILRSYHGHR